MGFKLFIGETIQNTLDNLIKWNYNLLPVIPNGRILALDLKRANINPQTIFDVGANIGQTAHYFYKHFPESTIYCFEPVKSVYDELVNSTKNTTVKCINEALGSSIQDMAINKNTIHAQSSIVTNDGRFSETEIIKVNTGHNFCVQHKIEYIDLLKIDVEGYELEVLKGFESIIKNVKMIYAEVGFDKNDPYKTYISDLLAFSSANGFIVSNFYDPSRWGKSKLRLGFYNVLLINESLIGT
jgi:FkbM family methyltransferase